MWVSQSPKVEVGCVALGQRGMDGVVAVSKDEHVRRRRIRVFQHGHGVLDQMFVLQFAHGVLTSGAALLGPAPRQLHPPVWMEGPEEGLTPRGGEHVLEHLVGGVAWPQSVAMSHHAQRAVAIQEDGLAVDGHAKFFFKVAVGPEVVVAHMVMDGQSGVGEFSRWRP